MSTDIKDHPTYQATRQVVLQKLQATDPALAEKAVGDGWLDEMLINFFTELAKRVGDLFLTIVEPIKRQLMDIGQSTYRSGIERLQPTPPLTLEKVINIAGDATADAIAEEVIINSAALLIQVIPFLNMTAAQNFVQLFADLSPDTEIAKIVTRVLTKTVIADPIQDWANLKYRPRSLKSSDAEKAYRIGKLTKEGLALAYAKEGLEDSAIKIMLQLQDREIEDSLGQNKPPDEPEIKQAYLRNVILKEGAVGRLQNLNYSPDKIRLLVSVWDHEKAEKIKDPPMAVGAFERLLGDIARLDSYDLVFTRWLGDIRDRITESKDRLKELTGITTTEATLEKEKLTDLIRILTKDLRTAFSQRSKLLGELDRLRRIFAADVFSQVQQVLKDHKGIEELLGTEGAKNVSSILNAGLRPFGKPPPDRWGELQSILSKEFIKDPTKVIPPPPTQTIKLRGTGVPALADLGRSLELNLGTRVIPGIAADPRIPLKPEDLDFLGARFGVHFAKGLEPMINALLKGFKLPPITISLPQPIIAGLPLPTPTPIPIPTGILPLPTLDLGSKVITTATVLTEEQRKALLALGSRVILS